MTTFSQIKSKLFRLLIYLGLGASFSTIVLIVVLIVAYFLPTIVIIVTGNHRLFSPQQLKSISSPDDKYLLTISNKIKFPADNILDPSGILSVSLKDKNTNQTVDSIDLDIFEFDAIKEPIIYWNEDQVKIEKITVSQNLSINFKLPN